MTYPVQVSGLALTQVGSASNGLTVYSGTITGGANNAFAGLNAVISGFVLNNGVNNSDPNGYLVVASGTGTITVKNPNGVAETAPGALNLLAVNTNGPFIPSSNASGQSTPFPNPPAPGGLLVHGAPGGASLVAENFVNSWNFKNSQLAMQVDLDTLEGPQQGVNAISNVTSVTLAGYPATGYGSCSFVQWQGSYQKA
jgi:hypothetical protein